MNWSISIREKLIRARRASGLRLAILFVVFFVVVLEFRNFFPAASPAVTQSRYLLLRRAVVRGASVDLEDFEITSVSPPAEFGIALSDQDLPLLKGAFYEVDLGRGSYLGIAQLRLSPERVGLGKIIPRGARAYALPFSEPIAVRYGDHIDLYGGSRKGVVVENAFVLMGNEKRRPFLLLALTPDELSIVDAEKEKGSLTVVVRAEGESETVKRKNVRKGAPGKVSVLTEED